MNYELVDTLDDRVLTHVSQILNLSPEKPHLTRLGRLDRVDMTMLLGHSM
jgi:hypothetical protein